MDPDSPGIDSLFDFLYVDRSRLEAIAAQLFKQGILRSTVSRGETFGKSGGTLTAGPRSLNFNLHGGSETKEGYEHHFDSSWSLPLNVLDALDEHGFINDIEAAALGNIFLLRGTIQIFDFRILGRCWEDMARMWHANQSKKPSQNEITTVEALCKILSKFPHSTELMFHTPQQSVWCAPDPANLTIPTETLAFSHGASIPGEWSLIATLDAYPAPKDNDEFMAQLAADAAARPFSKESQLAIAQLMNHLRGYLGRPYYSYGATPLVIMRKATRRVTPSAPS